MARDVFICHASTDKSVADAVCAALEGHGVGCWIAPRDVRPAQEYAEAIVQAIPGSALVLLVFSSAANDSPHVARELERAISKRVPVLAFRVEQVMPSATLEYFISSSQWLDALPPPVDDHLDRLVEAVESIVFDRPGAEAAPTGELTSETAVAATAAEEAPADTSPPPGDVRPAWSPTHVVPSRGMWVWSEPDPRAQPSDQLDPGLGVRVTERSGNWARVVCSNGFAAWVDARQLVAGEGEA